MIKLNVKNKRLQKIDERRSREIGNNQITEIYEGKILGNLFFNNKFYIFNDNLFSFFKTDLFDLGKQYEIVIDLLEETIIMNGIYESNNKKYTENEDYIKMNLFIKDNKNNNLQGILKKNNIEKETSEIILKTQYPKEIQTIGAHRDLFSFDLEVNLILLEKDYDNLADIFYIGYEVNNEELISIKLEKNKLNMETITMSGAYIGVFKKLYIQKSIKEIFDTNNIIINKELFNKN